MGRMKLIDKRLILREEVAEFGDKFALEILIHMWEDLAFLRKA